jgi:hypothetical protein
MRAPTPFATTQRGGGGWQSKNFLEVKEMRYVVSLVISIVVWKLVVGPAVAEAVKALETAACALGG